MIKTKINIRESDIIIKTKNNMREDDIRNNQIIT